MKDLKFECGFDFADGGHVPTVKISLPTCEADDNAAWDSRDKLASDIRAMLAAGHMPPAGGEVKNIGGIDVGSANVQRFWAEEARNIRCVRESDFDSHVTRLQAEVAALQARLTVADQRVDDLQSERDALKAEVDDLLAENSLMTRNNAAVGRALSEIENKNSDLQSDLTKARELLSGSYTKFKYIEEGGSFYQSTAAEGMRLLHKARQSAPAAKDVSDE